MAPRNFSRLQSLPAEFYAFLDSLGGSHPTQPDVNLCGFVQDVIDGSAGGHYYETDLDADFENMRSVVIAFNACCRAAKPRLPG